MADHGHGGGGGHAPASGGGGHAPSGGGGAPFDLKITGFIIVVLFFIFWVFKPLHKNDQKQVTQVVQVTEPDRNVNYGPNFGRTEILPPGYDYYFAEATEPYCYTNAVDSLACAGAGQDATGKFGNSPNNKALRFKSSNGKNGHLTIKFIKQ